MQFLRVNNKTTVIAKCMQCASERSVTVDNEKIARYLSGELVQSVWPDLTPGEREILIGARNSGLHICEACWDNVMGDEQ